MTTKTTSTLRCTKRSTQQQQQHKIALDVIAMLIKKIKTPFADLVRKHDSNLHWGEWTKLVPQFNTEDSVDKGCFHNGK